MIGVSELMSEQETGLSRRDREREQHRSDILDAAERVFVRDGFSAKIETIAKEAEYAVGSIYNFFPSKDDLFKNVLLRISQLRIANVENNLPEMLLDPWCGLRKICHLWVDHHVRHGDFLNIVRSQCSRQDGGLLPHDDPIGQKALKNVFTYRELLLKFFEALIATPEARTIEPEIMYVAFEGYVRTSLFMAFREGQGKFDQLKFEEDVYRALCKLFRK